MRSIRLSLVVYFLFLLGIAFVIAFWQVYQTASETLQAKEEADRKLVEKNFETQCREQREDLDQRLRLKAQSLARLVRFNDNPNFRERLLMGMVFAAPSAGGQIPVWGTQLWVALWDADRYQRSFAAIRLDRDDPLLGKVADYYQVGTSWGASYRSDPKRSISFPKLEDFSPGHVLDWRFFDSALKSGEKLRWVALKVPATRLFVQLTTPKSPWPVPGTRDSDEPQSRLPVIDGFVPLPSLFIQCAASTRDLDQELHKLAETRDHQFASFADETAASLAQLRRRLLLVGSLTFACTVLGSFWLVGLGLSPLRRLSEAVRHISPRDIRLPWAQSWLPLELRPIVQRLTETFELLQRAFAREKQATADISHELRTPLAALLATTELALRKPRTPEQYAEMLATCRTSAQHMNQIVERLLTLARLDAGVDSMRLRPVDAAVVAAQCAAVVRPLAEARGLTLTVQSPADQTTELMTDPDKLSEVVNNLLHNAIQYNRPSGRVELLVGRSNGSVRVEVRDTGVGIAPEQRGHIFERFYRADPSRQSDGLNAGLGLAIVKEYVELMGGTIEVDSTLGQGSTFRILLPVNESKSAPQRLPA